MYGLKGGAVSIPRWILIFRAGQLFFAILVLALTAYSLSVHGGGPLQPPLIATIIISGLTLIPIPLLTTPLHLAQRKAYDPRIALLLDGFAALYWLAAFAALASYQRIFRDWGRDIEFTRVALEWEECGRCRRAWKTGVAATVFSAVEFLLFVFTTLAFLYYYHFHLAGTPAPGLAGRGTETDKTATGAAAGTTAGGAGAAAATGHSGEQHQMHSMPPHSNNPGPRSNAPYGNDVNVQGGAGNDIDPPYPNDPRPPRQGGYGGYEDGANVGYGPGGR